MKGIQSALAMAATGTRNGLTALTGGLSPGVGDDYGTGAGAMSEWLDANNSS